jgi:hypothetical protein
VLDRLSRALRSLGRRPAAAGHRLTALKNGWLLACIGVWAAAVVGGEVWMWRYQLTPGAAPGPAPRTWPANSTVPDHRGRPLLLMVAHPRCPCTRASLNELRKLMARFQALPVQPDLYLSLIVPDGVGPEWIDGPVMRNAASIPSLHVVLDPGGRFATRLGATTSGHVVVYGADDSLLFSGGITSARAHEGDSEGQGAIVKALYGRDRRIRDSAVYGCGLVDDGEDAKNAKRG